MPILVLTTSVPANGISFPLVGSVYEYLTFPANVEIAMNQQSGAVGAVLATVNSGPDTLQEEGAISANARVPIYPDDFILQDEAAQGDRLRVQLRNTTAGIIVVVTAVRLTPLV